MRRTRWLGLLLGGVLLLLTPQRASACSHCRSLSGKAALPSAGAMFTGTATHVEYLQPDTGSNEPLIEVTFDVSEVWKGPVRKTFLLRTTYNRFTCGGYYFRKGGAYLVTASQVDRVEKDRAHLAGADPCGSTVEMTRAVEILRELGKGERPRAVRAKTPTR